MIGSATNLSVGKKLLGVLVAIAMVLTMSNIAVWTADANETDNGVKSLAVSDKPEDTSKDAEEVENTPAASDPAEEPAQKEESGDTTTDDVDKSADDADKKAEGETTESTDDPEEVATKDDSSLADETTASTPAVVAEDAEEAEEEEPVVDEEGTHSITVRAKIYQSGKLVNTIEGVEKGPLSSKLAFDLRSFIINAKKTVGEGWALDKSDPEPPSDNSGIVLGPAYDSKLVVYKFYYDLDTIKDPGNSQSGAQEVGDGIPDKYQKLITYKIQNGAWNKSGDKADKTEYVTFYDKNGLSNASGATALLRLPAIEPTPDQYFTENGSWNIDSREPVVTFGGADEFTYTYESDATMHTIYASINYYLDGKLDKVVTSNCVGSIEDDLVYNFTQRVFTIANPYKSTGKVLYDRIECAFDYNDDAVMTLPKFKESMELGEINVYYWSDTMGPDDPNKPDGIRDVCQVKLNFNIQNGYLVNEREATKVYTMMKDGKPNEDATLVINLPASKPYDGFVKDAKKEYGGGWSDSRVTSSERLKISRADNDLTLINTYVRAPFAYTVYYMDDQTNIPILDAEVYSARYLDKISASDHAIDINGYVYSYANIDELTVGSNPSDNGITLFYDVDANEDGIADKYQVTVNYGAINGTIQGDYTEIVNLYDANGNLSVNGTGKLAHIPTFTPNAGFGNGAWSAAGQPTPNTVITKDTNFLITYVANTPSSNKGNTGNGGSNKGTNGGDNGDDRNTGGNGDRNTYDPSEPGYVPYGPGDGATVAADDPEADAADEETVEEEAIPEDENPLTEPEDQNASDDQQVITDDENALSDYAETSFNWIPIAVAGGAIVIAGGIFLASPKRRMAILGIKSDNRK